VSYTERGIHAIDYAGLGAIGAYLLDCRDGGLQPRTILLKHNRLTTMQAAIGVELVAAGEADLNRWWRRLATADLAQNTRGIYLSHARTFYSWAVLESLVPCDPTARIRAPRRRRGVPRDVDPARVLGLLGRLSGQHWYMVALMLHCGLRCAEVAPVRPERDLVERGAGHVLHVMGKGGNARWVSVPAGLAKALAVAPPGYLFPSARNPSGHVLADWVSRTVADVLRGGGIDATAHQLRHTNATTIWRKTHDLLALQQHLGHATVATVTVYARTEGLSPGVADHLFDPAA
jgi:integrase/recombinase XerC